MKTKSIFSVSILAVVLMLGLSAFVPNNPNEKDKGEAWDIPEKFQTMKNPYADDVSLVKFGKTQYMKHCRSCHGNVGLGDGPKAKSLDTFPGLFNSKEFQAQSDGTIYYQSILGRNEMPNYESKIPDEEDRWALIMYLRTLK